MVVDFIKRGGASADGSRCAESGDVADQDDVQSGGSQRTHADSRPEPGPFTRTSTLFIPYWSRATPAAASEACCAAYGVPLREPLKPIAPAEDQQTTRPSVSVMEICVLLNDAAT